MKELSFEQMECLNGGTMSWDCGMAIIGTISGAVGVIATDGLLLGFLAGLGYASAVGGLHTCMDE